MEDRNKERAAIGVQGLPAMTASAKLTMKWGFKMIDGKKCRARRDATEQKSGRVRTRSWERTDHLATRGAALALAVSGLLGCASLPLTTVKGPIWAVRRLRTDGLSRPLGINSAAPELAWRVDSTSAGSVQVAYEVELATSELALGHRDGDLWDSGKVLSEQPWTNYNGPQLLSARRYYWRVIVWDRDGHDSGWSAATSFEMGLLTAADWAPARWIVAPGSGGGNRIYAGYYFRKAFVVGGRVESARLYHSATGEMRHCVLSTFPQACRPASGLVRVSLNGKPVNDHELDPAPTNSQRALYTTTDVTALVKSGSNVLGMSIAGDSELIAKLVIRTENGRMQTIATNVGWMTHTSPIVHADRFAGVQYDARLELPDWNRSQTTPATGWVPAQDASAQVGAITLSSAAELPPMRIVRRLNPVAVWKNSPGKYTFKFATDFTGRVHIRLSGTPGAVITIVQSDHLRPSRSGFSAEADPQSTGFKAFQTDRYTIGDHPANWSSRFTYYALSYATVSGMGSRPAFDEIWGEQLNSAFRRTGTFESSDALLNSIHAGAVQTTLNDAHGIPEDCPNREKRGWAADAYVSDPQALANFDVKGFFENYLQDVRDSQKPSGAVPDIDPAEPGYATTLTISQVGAAAQKAGFNLSNAALIKMMKGSSSYDSEWGLVAVELPWDLYWRYGDPRILRVSYASMKRFIDWCARQANGYILYQSQFRSDWAAYKPTDDPLLRTALWYLGVQHLIGTARVLDHPADVRQYEALAAHIRTAFNQQFLDATKGIYRASGKQATTTSQASFALPLVTGLVPRADRAKVTANFVSYIEDVSHDHPESGLNATRYVLEALEKIHRPDLFNAMVEETTSPSWGYMVEHGPGTLWETWTPGRGTFTHSWSGSVDAYFYRIYAGLNATSPGFKTALIRPYTPANISWVRAQEETPYGPLASAWRKTKSGLRMEVSVPVGVTARIVVPVPRGGEVHVAVNGRAVRNLADVTALRRIGNGRASMTFEVGSGHYDFRD